MTMVINKDYIDTMLDAGTDIQALLNSAVVRLFKNNLTPTCLSVAGDFTVANFTGYAQQTPTFGNATVGTCVATMDAGNIDFAQSGTGVTNDIYGYYLWIVGDANWLIAERNAAAPVAMNATGYVYRVSLKFNGQEIP